MKVANSNEVVTFFNEIRETKKERKSWQRQRKDYSHMLDYRH